MLIFIVSVKSTNSKSSLEGLIFQIEKLLKDKKEPQDNDIRNCLNQAEKIIEQENDFGNEPLWIKIEIGDNLLKLTRKLIELDKTKFARRNMRIEHDFCRKLFTNRILLEKLQHLAVSMQKIAEAEANGSAKEYFSFMEEIISEMREASDEDKVTKTLMISSVYVAYSFCCIETSNFGKAIEILKPEIRFLEKFFGKKTYHHQLLALCYKNLGVSLQRLGLTKEARNAYANAKKVGR